MREGRVRSLTLPLSGRHGAWGGEAESWWRPVHSKGLLGFQTSDNPDGESTGHRTLAIEQRAAIC
jgi:hypothetical protein